MGSPLASLDILITGDYSDLEQSITEATSAASAAGEAISEAFNQPDAGAGLATAVQAIADSATAAVPQLTALGDEAQQLGDGAATVQPLSDALQSVGDAANTAAPDLNDAGSAAEQVGEAAGEAEGNLSEMAEALVGIGEALAVTEGLKEFGEEALEAYGTVQSVTIGLTQLTGSVDTANEAIEQIKNLAATEPFAFPDIAPTVQKMVALGVSAEQLPSVMQAVADAAAATGNQFNQVANSLDRMSLSGTANARSLTQLGIGAQDLAAAMGVTAAQVTAAFKALDQSQRLDVLQEALTKFSGAAVAQAQGIAGAWQIFENQFEEVMVGVGEALAPAVTAVLGFGKEALAAAQSAVDAFNSLPEPLKEVLGGVALLAAAVAPLTVAVGAFGLGVIGIQAAIGPLNTLLGALGLASKDVAVGETAAAVAGTELAESQAAVATSIITTEAAVGEAGAATILAAEGFSSLGVSVGGLALVFAGPLIASLVATQSNLNDLKERWTEVLQEINSNSIVSAIDAGATIQGLEDIGYSVDQIKTAFGSFGLAGATAVDQLNQSMKAPVPTLTSLGVSIDDIQTKLKGLQVDGIPVFQILANSPDFATFKNNIVTLGGNLEQVIQKLNQLGPNATSAVAGFKSMADGLGIVVVNTENAQKGLDALTASQAKANQAVQAAKAILDLAAQGLDGTTQAQGVYNAALVAYDKALTTASPHAKDFADSIAGITQSIQLAQEKASSSVSVFDSLNASFNNGVGALSAVAEAYTKAQSAAKTAGDAFATAAGQQLLLNQGYTNTKTVFDANTAALDALVTKYQTATLSTQQAAEVQQQIVTLYKTTETESNALGISYYNQGAATISLTAAATGQQTALQNVITTYEGLKTQANQSAASIEASGVAFKTIQTDAAGLGLTVQQVGNGLVFTADAALSSNPKVVALAQALTQAANAGLSFAIVNGQLVPIQQQMGNAAGVAAGQVGTLVTTADGGTVAVLGMASAVPKATQALTDHAAAAQSAAAGQGMFNAQVAAAPQSLDPFSAAAVSATANLSGYGNNAMTVGQVLNGTLTPALHNAVVNGFDPFSAAAVAATANQSNFASTLITGGQAMQDAAAHSSILATGATAIADGFAAAKVAYDNAAASASADTTAEEGLSSSIVENTSDMQKAANEADVYAGQLQSVGTAATTAAAAVQKLNTQVDNTGGAGSMNNTGGPGGAQGDQGFEGGSGYIGFLSPYANAGIAKMNVVDTPIEGVGGSFIDQQEQVEQEIEQLSGAMGTAYTGAVAATDPLIAATNANTAATTDNTTATTADTTATTAATTATTAAVTATQALQDVNTALGTNFTDLGSATQELETLIGETGGSVQQSLENLISEVNGVNAPVQDVAYSLSGSSTSLSSAADAASSSLTGLVSNTDDLSTSTSTASGDVLGVLANLRGMTLTLSGFNADMASLTQELNAGQISLSDFNEEAQTLSSTLAQETQAVTNMGTAASGAAQALSNAAGVTEDSADVIQKALATYVQGQASYYAQQSLAGQGAANVDTANQNSTFNALSALGTAFTNSTGLTLPNTGVATAKVNPNLTYDPSTGAYTLAVSLPNLPNGESITGTATATGTSINAAGQANLYNQAYAAAMDQYYGVNPLAAPSAGGMEGQSSSGPNYAAYAPTTGMFTPTTPQYSSGNPLPVVVQNQTVPAITINIPGATVVGSNGAQQLAQAVQQQIVTTLRQAGLKL
jgi:Tape measure protein